LWPRWLQVLITFNKACLRSRADNLRGLGPGFVGVGSWPGSGLFRRAWLSIEGFFFKLN